MAPIQGVHGVRYQVSDVARAASFYTTHLGSLADRTASSWR
jgi:hypothetical protein